MVHQLLFLSTIPLRPSPLHTFPSKASRQQAAPQALTPQPSPPAKLITPTNLAQAARVVMSVFQLSAFFTPILINPLYTSQILSILPQNYPVIQALGLTNLSTVLAFYAHRHHIRSCALANSVVFAATAAAYLIIPIKPQLVNIPFTSSLIFIALANAFASLKTRTTFQSTTPSLPTLVRFLAASAAISAAFLNPLPLQSVYLFQIGINLAAAAALASCGQSTDRSLYAPEIALLLATAACLSTNATTIPAAMLALTALLVTTRFFSHSKEQAG